MNNVFKDKTRSEALAQNPPAWHKWDRTDGAEIEIKNLRRKNASTKSCV